MFFAFIKNTIVFIIGLWFNFNKDDNGNYAQLCSSAPNYLTRHVLRKIKTKLYANDHCELKYGIVF